MHITHTLCETTKSDGYVFVLCHCHVYIISIIMILMKRINLISHYPYINSMHMAFKRVLCIHIVCCVRDLRIYNIASSSNNTSSELLTNITLVYQVLLKGMASYFSDFKMEWYYPYSFYCLRNDSQSCRQSEELAIHVCKCRQYPQFLYLLVLTQKSLQSAVSPHSTPHCKCEALLISLILLVVATRVANTLRLD